MAKRLTDEDLDGLDKADLLDMMSRMKARTARITQENRQIKEFMRSMKIDRSYDMWVKSQEFKKKNKLGNKR